MQLRKNANPASEVGNALKTSFIVIRYRSSRSIYDDEVLFLLKNYFMRRLKECPTGKVYEHAGPECECAGMRMRRNIEYHERTQRKIQHVIFETIEEVVGGLTNFGTIEVISQLVNPVDYLHHS